MLRARLVRRGKFRLQSFALGLSTAEESMRDIRQLLAGKVHDVRGAADRQMLHIRDRGAQHLPLANLSLGQTG